jgi:hypothetical protein
MAKGITDNPWRSNKKKRPGIHARKKTSNQVNSKHYKKSYRGQGR